MVIPTTPYARAIEEVFRILSGIVFPDKKPNQPVTAYLAGGSAVYLYTQHRISKDVDVDFASKILRPEVVVAYMNESGEEKSIHLDLNYNGTFGVMHEDYDLRAKDTNFLVPGFNIKVLSPVDLAISKLARFSERDQGDIDQLIQSGLIERDEFETLANEAISYFVGNTIPVIFNIKKTLESFPLPKNENEPRP